MTALWESPDLRRTEGEELLERASRRHREPAYCGALLACTRGPRSLGSSADGACPSSQARSTTTAKARGAARHVVASGRYILGPEVEAFEREFAAYLGAGHVVGVANGTDALTIALRAMGVGPGDEVVCPSLTFYATAEAIVNAGATPGVLRRRPRHLLRHRRQRPAALTARTQGDRARAPVRQRGARGRAARVRRAGAGGRRPGRRRQRSTGCAPERSATRPRSASSRPRTFPASATAGRSRPATTRWPSARARFASTARRTSAPHGGGLQLAARRAPGRGAARAAARARPLERGAPRRGGGLRAPGLAEHVRLPVATAGAEHVFHLYVVRASGRRRTGGPARRRGRGGAGLLPHAGAPPAGDGAVRR